MGNRLQMQMLMVKQQRLLEAGEERDVKETEKQDDPNQTLAGKLDENEHSPDAAHAQRAAVTRLPAHKGTDASASSSATVQGGHADVHKCIVADQHDLEPLGMLGSSLFVPTRIDTHVEEDVHTYSERKHRCVFVRNACKPQRWCSPEHQNLHKHRCVFVRHTHPPLHSHTTTHTGFYWVCISNDKGAHTHTTSPFRTSTMTFAAALDARFSRRIHLKPRSAMDSGSNDAFPVSQKGSVCSMHQCCRGLDS